MMTPRRGLTEFEGAILGVLSSGKMPTAYRVRQVFRASPSVEWSGSAGAVYPAIKRMKAAGFLKERAVHDGRGTKTCELTTKGKALHRRWLLDVDRAIGPGMDPFRTRAGLWSGLAPKERGQFAQKLKKEIVSSARDFRERRRPIRATLSR